MRPPPRVVVMGWVMGTGRPPPVGGHLPVKATGPGGPLRTSRCRWVSSPLRKPRPPSSPAPLISIPRPLPAGGTPGVPPGGGGEGKLLKGQHPFMGAGAEETSAPMTSRRAHPPPKGTRGGVGEGMGEPPAALEETPPLPSADVTQCRGVSRRGGATPPLPRSQYNGPWLRLGPSSSPRPRRDEAPERYVGALAL